ARLTDRPHLLAQHRVEPRALAPAAVLGGPVRCEPAALGEEVAELPRVLGLGLAPGSVLGDALPVGRELGGEELLQLLPEARLVFPPLEVHPRWSRLPCAGGGRAFI